MPVDDPLDAARDPQMPFLALALDLCEAERQLSGALEDRVGGAVRISAMRVVRHKPGRRCLIEYDVETPSLARFTVIGKARAKGPNRDVFALMQCLWRSGFSDQSEDGVSVPEPLGIVPAFHMWLQRKIGGVSLTSLLAHSSGVSLCERVASALHKVHKTKVPTGRSHTLADELMILDERLAEASVDHPRLAPRIGQLRDACSELARSLQPVNLTGIHRDFYPDQVHLDGERLYLLDFDLFAQGDPALDAGNFIGHLTEHSLRHFGDAAALAERESAFEDAFVAHWGKESRSSVRAYATLTLARHVALSTRYPDRRHLTEPLLELCEEREKGVGSHSRPLFPAEC